MATKLDIQEKDGFLIMNDFPDNCIFNKVKTGCGATTIVHIPADTRSAFPVISVQSPVSIQCCWQS